MGVHDVEVDPVRACALDTSQRMREVGQIRVQDAGCDPRSTARHG